MLKDPIKYLERFDCRIVPTDRKRIINTIKKYKYIESDILWFDYEEYQEEANWYDIEGMGYGWLWLHRKPKEYRDVIVKMTKHLLLKCKLYYKMGIQNTEDGVIFHIPSHKQDCVYTIVLSNKEIFC